MQQWDSIYPVPTNRGEQVQWSKRKEIMFSCSLPDMMSRYPPGCLFARFTQDYSGPICSKVRTGNGAIRC
jgi:hypothetical protein